MAPELLSATEDSELEGFAFALKCDIWALGMVIYVRALHDPPIRDHLFHQIALKFSRRC